MVLRENYSICLLKNTAQPSVINSLSFQMSPLSHFIFIFHSHSHIHVSTLFFSLSHTHTLSRSHTHKHTVACPCVCSRSLQLTLRIKLDRIFLKHFGPQSRRHLLGLARMLVKFGNFTKTNLAVFV